jgi:hypothetical protein
MCLLWLVSVISNSEMRKIDLSLSGKPQSLKAAVAAPSPYSLKATLA